MARTEPGYDFFPPDRPDRPDRPGRPLPSLSPDDADDAPPSVPTGRLSAPPPNVPPVFERPAPPRGDARSWAVTGPATPVARPVPAFTAYAPRPTDRLPLQGRATDPPTAPDPFPPAGPPVVDPAVMAAARPADLTLGRRAGRRPGRVAVGAMVTALLGTGACATAVVGVPWYLDRADRAVWERTTVRLPRTLVGLPRVTTAGATAEARTAQQNLLSTGAGQLISDLAVYGGRTGARMVVVVGRPQHPLDARERDLVRAGYTRAVAASGVVLTERDPGDLGGWFGCGVHRGRTTTCLAIDAGAAITVTVTATATGPRALTLAHQACAALKQRT